MGGFRIRILCPDDGIGIRVGLRNQILKVRLLPRGPIKGVSSVAAAQLSVKQLGRVQFSLSPQKSSLGDSEHRLGIADH